MNVIKVFHESPEILMSWIYLAGILSSDYGYLPGIERSWIISWHFSGAWKRACALSYWHCEWSWSLMECPCVDPRLHAYKCSELLLCLPLKHVQIWDPVIFNCSDDRCANPQIQLLSHPVCPPWETVVLNELECMCFFSNLTLPKYTPLMWQ